MLTSAWPRRANTGRRGVAERVSRQTDKRQDRPESAPYGGRKFRPDSTHNYTPKPPAELGWRELPQDGRRCRRRQKAFLGPTSLRPTSRPPRGQPASRAAAATTRSIMTPITAALSTKLARNRLMICGTRRLSGLLSECPNRCFTRASRPAWSFIVAPKNWRCCCSGSTCRRNMAPWHPAGAAARESFRT